MHTLAFAPLVLGVPHLLADLRYLVLRPRLHLERPALVAIAAVPLAVGAFTQNVAASLTSAVLAALLARGSLLRRAAVAAVALGAVAIAATRPMRAALVLAHAHNAVGAVFVLAVFSRRRWLEAIPIATFVLLATALVAGLFDGALLRPFALEAPHGTDPLGLTLARLAPVDDPFLAVRLVALYVFAQGVHYVAWLRLVPELARERPGIRSFASSARAARRDLGVTPIALGAAAMIALVILAATRSPAAARDAYLSLAAFHGPLELAALALVAVEGRQVLGAAGRTC